MGGGLLQLCGRRHVSAMLSTDPSLGEWSIDVELTLGERFADVEFGFEVPVLGDDDPTVEADAMEFFGAELLWSLLPRAPASEELI